MCAGLQDEEEEEVGGAPEEAKGKEKQDLTELQFLLS